MLEIRMESKELDVLLHPNLLTFTGIWLKLVVAAEPANHVSQLGQKLGFKITV